MTYILVWIIIFIIVIAVVRHYVQKKASFLKTAGMGIVSLLGSLLCCAMILALFDSEDNSDKTKSTISQSNQIVDSSFISPSVNTDSILEIMKNDFRFSKDEFDDEGKVWVELINQPSSRRINAYYCYFQMNGDKSVSNFRFVLQYESDDWLFIRNCIFNIDGDNIEFVPHKMERDNEGGRIWEWFDESVGRNNIGLIRKISKAKNVKVKLVGDQYYDTRTISSKQIASIGKVLEYYEKMGGKFQ